MTLPISTDSRAEFRRWTDCLLDPSRTPLDQLEAAWAWHDWALRFLGIDEGAPRDLTSAFFADTHLAHGKAISPLGAVRCVREFRRTAVFLQAMDAALREAKRRFPGERIHVLEAGCGPLAPLALPFALRYPANEVTFTLLDLHPVALEGARRITEELGLDASIRGYKVDDAATMRFAEEDRPHVIACEVLLRALIREPQVAVTANLAPQLRRGGVFLPERIDVDAALFSAARYFEYDGVRGASAAGQLPGLVRIGPVFSLEAATVQFLSQPSPGSYRAHRVVVPAHDKRTPLRLLTRIRVFDDHWLGDFDSSLNLPERITYSEEIARHGGELDFVYEVSSDPGLRIVSCRSPLER